MGKQNDDLFILVTQRKKNERSYYLLAKSETKDLQRVLSDEITTFEEHRASKIQIQSKLYLNKFDLKIYLNLKRKTEKNIQKIIVYI